MASIAVIGGTGLSEFLQGESLAVTSTPYGELATPLMVSDIAGKAVAFLPRHGSPHRIPPDRINYRANLWALQAIGVRKIIAVNAVGGINPELAAGTLVIPDQLIDYTYGRQQSFYDGSSDRLEHIDFSYPFSNELGKVLESAAADCQLKLTRGGVYAVTQGPRLETAAEIQRLGRDGCDIVGMTAMPEAALARELEIDYASLSLVVNPAAGLGDELITMEDIHAVTGEGMIAIKAILQAAIERL